MTAIPANIPVERADSGGQGDDYLSHGRGILSWAFTLDHKRIGIMYMYGVLFAFLLAGIFALVLRTMLFTPIDASKPNAGQWFEAYNHIFTLHGAVMIFMFIIPAIPAILGNFVLPLQLGAKDVAFPRLNLLSFYFYAIGGLFFVYILLSGVIHVTTGHKLPGGFGLDTGWTFYTPYSTTRSASAIVPATLGVFIMGFSSILTGINFVASIHMLRPRGMTWFRIPLFLWALYATSIIQILATPVLAITVLLLFLERVWGIGIFDPRNGGDPVLFQHFFWFYSHPAVYIMILPAMGVVSEIFAAFSRKGIFGYTFIAYSSLAIALLSFLVWGHHMFVSGQSLLMNAIFSLLTFSVAIPSAIKVFNWLATLYKADIHLKTPMLWALGFIFMFTLGGLTGLFLGTLNIDVHLTNTYFIVAHFHYVMMGSSLFAFIGGMYYWWPKITGKMCDERVGIIAVILVFIGFNITFLPQFVMGIHGMPRRYASYPMYQTDGEGQVVKDARGRPVKTMFLSRHRESTIGSYLMGAGLFLVLANWLHSLRSGKKAPPNPWGANTLEWQTASPPPYDNFATEPKAGEPYDMHAWVYDPVTDGWVKSPEQ
ncbi:MAG: cbb3-type cytochrome c oxidase subunit I [Tepidisphaeraceae bacterium]